MKPHPKWDMQGSISTSSHAAHDLRSSIIKSQVIPGMAPAPLCQVVPLLQSQRGSFVSCEFFRLNPRDIQAFENLTFSFPRYTKLDPRPLGLLMYLPKLWQMIIVSIVSIDVHLLLISTEVYTASGNKPQMKAIVRTKPNLALVRCSL